MEGSDERKGPRVRVSFGPGPNGGQRGVNFGKRVTGGRGAVTASGALQVGQTYIPVCQEQSWFRPLPLCNY